MIKGIGIDIIEIERIQKAIDRWGNNFLEFVFTPDEIAYAQKHKFPAQHLAARLAAKEAVFKAFGNRPKLSWKDIAIKNDKYGRPICKFKDPQFKKKILISLSHSDHYAVASAIIAK